MQNSQALVHPAITTIIYSTINEGSPKMYDLNAELDNMKLNANF